MEDQRQGRASDLIVVSAIVLVSVIGLPRLLSLLSPPAGQATAPGPVASSGEAGRYAGSDSCAECHPGASAYHSNSGHARTIRPAAGRRLARALDGRVVPDPERPGVSWGFALEDGRLWVERAEGGAVERSPIDFAFGSGHHATTFVTLTDTDPERPEALEHRLTHFTEGNRFGVTPGQRADSGLGRDGPMGFELPPGETLKCFGCHTTTTSAAGPEALDLASMIPNVSCERCHGPARAHVEAARRGEEDLAMPFGLDSWTAEEQMALCGSCHRHPSKAPPGIIRPDNVQLARFQPVGIMQSRCYTEADGAFSCVSCHDPHDRAASDPASYEASCLRCHGPDPTTTPTAPESPPSGCLDCHMPAVDSGQGVLFTDHWIRVRSEAIGRGPCTRPAAGTAPSP